MRFFRREERQKARAQYLLRLENTVIGNIIMSVLFAVTTVGNITRFARGAKDSLTVAAVVCSILGVILCFSQAIVGEYLFRKRKTADAKEAAEKAAKSDL
jgi:hypothetical protein